MKKPIFLYIYLNKKIQEFIKTGRLHSRMAAEDTISSKPSRRQWLVKIFLRAVFMSLLVYFTMVYIHQGTLVLNADGTNIINPISTFEIGATIVFLFLVFLVHRGISRLMNNNIFSEFNFLAKGILETFLVVMSCVIFLYLILYLPFTLAFPEIEVPPERIRFNYVVMAIIILFFYYFVERERNKKQLQIEMLRTARLQKENFEAQLQNLKSQVSPHFLFNSLNVLNSLIQQDRDKASHFTEKLSDLYRAFLENSDQQLISLEKELEVTRAYIYLLETRFGQAVRFVFEIPPEKEKLKLPPGSLQMLIENAIKHNGSTKKKPLIISLSVEGDFLKVQNNHQPRLEPVKSTKTGLENIRRRYKYLSEKEVLVENSEEKFTVKLPLIKLQNNESNYY